MELRPMTKRETAEFMRCSERTIDRFRSLGILRAVKLRGRVLFRPEDVQKAINKGVEPK
jgi:excisionase family DNA binding protein